MCSVLANSVCRGWCRVSGTQAIGQRNLVDYERESRRRKMATLRAHVSEKRAELERARAQLASLQKVEAQQKEMIEKMQAA